MKNFGVTKNVDFKFVMALLLRIFVPRRYKAVACQGDGRPTGNHIVHFAYLFENIHTIITP